MYLLKDSLKFPEEEFQLMKHRPYSLKPLFTMKRIEQWHEYWGGQVYVSFSGGLDSTVLAYLVCQTYEKEGFCDPLPLVFSDTGMEFPEIREFVQEYVRWLQGKFPRVKTELKVLHPRKNFRWVCENCGFPILSKDTASKIEKLRHGKLSPQYRNYLLHGDERGRFGMLSKKWQYLADPKQMRADISPKCCEVLKKEPFQRYSRMTGRKPLIGVTQDESFRRENQYRHTGCNVYEGKTIKSQPMGFWRKQEVIRYAVEQQIPWCSVYGRALRNPDGTWRMTGEARTGCVLCGFGCHLEKESNRLQRLGVSSNPRHRAMYQWGMELKNNGMTYREALNRCGIPTEYEETEGKAG